MRIPPGIRIDSDRDGRYTVLIEDDGYGMAPASDGRPVNISACRSCRSVPAVYRANSVLKAIPVRVRVLLSFTSAEQALPTRAAGG